MNSLFIVHPCIKLTFGYNINLGTTRAIDVYFFFLYNSSMGIKNWVQIKMKNFEKK